MQDDEEEDEDDADLQPDADRLEPLIGPLSQRGEQRCRPLRREGAALERKDSRVDLGAAVQEQGPDNVEDHEQDEPGALGVAAEEARVATVGGGVVLQAQDREHDDADEDEDAEEILEEPDDRPGADDRHGEVGDEQGAVGLEDGEAEDEEAPEGEHVREARNRPLEQLLLPEHLDCLGLDPLRSILRSADRRLAGPGDREQEPPPLAG